MDSLRPLLDLQQVDLARDRLHERREHLPERADLAERQQRIREIAAAVDRVDQEAAEIIKEMNRFEGDLGILEEKIRREEGKLYSGEVINPKELSALQAEIEMFKRQKAPVEEGVLEQMVARDERYDERDRLRAEIADVEGEAEALRERISAQEIEIDAQLGAEQERRDALRSQVPDDILEIYEELRQQKKGIGVGALQDGVCTACREALSAVEVDRLKRQVREGEKLFRCEHCRRLLVVS